METIEKSTNTREMPSNEWVTFTTELQQKLQQHYGTLEGIKFCLLWEDLEKMANFLVEHGSGDSNLPEHYFLVKLFQESLNIDRV